MDAFLTGCSHQRVAVQVLNKELVDFADALNEDSCSHMWRPYLAWSMVFMDELDSMLVVRVTEVSDRGKT